MSKKHSTVSYQVMWNRMISVVEEQAQALVRTAFSTSVREAGDLSAGVTTSRVGCWLRPLQEPLAM